MYFNKIISIFLLISGPKRLEGPLLIPVTVFYVAVFLTGLMGNFSVSIQYTLTNTSRNILQ